MNPSIGQFCFIIIGASKVICRCPYSPACDMNTGHTPQGTSPWSDPVGPSQQHKGPLSSQSACQDVRVGMAVFSGSWAALEGRGIYPFSASQTSPLVRQ